MLSTYVFNAVNAISYLIKIRYIVFSFSFSKDKRSRGKRSILNKLTVKLIANL